MSKLLLILLIFSQFLISQNVISRFTIKDSVRNIELTRRFKSSIMDFKSPLEDGDFIVIGIVSDSLDTNKIGLRLYSYYPKNINPTETAILIFYEDNSKDILYPTSPPDTNNYVEYRFIMNSYSLHKKRAKRIQFRGIQTYPIEYQNYFVEFMQQLKYVKEN